jgi:hypothetical protein
MGLRSGPEAKEIQVMPPCLLKGELSRKLANLESFLSFILSIK